MSDASGQPPGTPPPGDGGGAPPPQTPPQSTAPPPPSGGSGGGSGGSSGMDPNLAGALTYLAGWITGIIFLLVEKENRFVRFHAWQSIVSSVIVMVLQLISSLVLGFTCIGPIVTLLAFMALWIFLMVMAYQGKMYKLPGIGDWAEKQN